MNLGLVMMMASRSSRLPSPSASIGVHNLRNWISLVASSPTPPESIGASDAHPNAFSSASHSRSFSSSSSRIGVSSGPKSGAFSSPSPIDPQSKAVKKRMMFKELFNLSETQGKVVVEETLELFRKEDETSFTKSDLVRWAKLLYKKGKLQHAVQIFNLMRRNNVAFSVSETAVYVDLLVKTEGAFEAGYYYWSLPFKQRSIQAYRTLMNGYPQKSEEERAKEFASKIKFPDVDDLQSNGMPKNQKAPPPPPAGSQEALHAEAAFNMRVQTILRAYADKLGVPRRKPVRIARKRLEELPNVGV